MSCHTFATLFDVLVVFSCVNLFVFRVWTEAFSSDETLKALAETPAGTKPLKDTFILPGEVYTDLLVRHAISYLIVHIIAFIFAAGGALATR